MKFVDTLINVTADVYSPCEDGLNTVGSVWFVGRTKVCDVIEEMEKAFFRPDGYRGFTIWSGPFNSVQLKWAYADWTLSQLLQFDRERRQAAEAAWLEEVEAGNEPIPF